MDLSGAPVPPVGRRRDARLRLGVPAQLITLSGQQTVNLSDLSQSGAHIRSDSPIERRGDAVLYWLGFEAFGRIVWARNGENASEAGLEFDDLLSEAVLIRTRDQVDSGKAKTAEQAAYEGARNWYMGYR